MHQSLHQMHQGLHHPSNQTEVNLLDRFLGWGSHKGLAFTHAFEYSIWVLYGQLDQETHNGE